MTSTPTKPTVAFAHLGCEKNRVDTEHMVGLLAEAGYSVSTDERDAAVVVVNTCSFIQDAREESVRTLVGLCLLYTSPSPRDVEESRMPSSA